MGCTTSKNQENGPRTQRTKRAVYAADAAPDAPVVAFESTDAPSTRCDNDSLASAADVAILHQDLTMMCGRSAGHRTPEPSEFSRSITQSMIVLRARVLDDVNEDPDQYAAIIKKQTSHILHESRRRNEDVMKWIDSVSACDDRSHLDHLFAASLSFETSRCTTNGASTIFLCSLELPGQCEEDTMALPTFSLRDERPPSQAAVALAS